MIWVQPQLLADVVLAQFTDTILKDVDSGPITGVAFLDVSKAFDKVNHDLFSNYLTLVFHLTLYIHLVLLISCYW